MNHPGIGSQTISLETVLAAKAHAGEAFTSKGSEFSIRKTPLWHSPHFTWQAGQNIYLKCEHLQRSGSFKVRGAWNWLFTHRDHCPSVVSCSGINHNMALAWASARMNIPCYLFFEEPVPRALISFLTATGAEWSESSRPEEECFVFTQKQAALNYQPRGNPEVLAGYATVFLEILEDLEWFDELWVHTIHGDLLHAAAIVMQALRPAMKLVACVGPDPQGDEFKVWDELKSIHPVRQVSCSQKYREQALDLLADLEKQIVETSGVLALAAKLEHGAKQSGNAVVLLTGGNQPHRRPGDSGA